MLLRDMTADKAQIPAQARVPEQFAATLGDFAPEDVIAVFGDPYEVVLNLVDGVGAAPVISHGSVGLASREASFAWKLILRDQNLNAKAVRLKAKVLDQPI